jgi:outer membrane protein assembly factor BamB
VNSENVRFAVVAGVVAIVFLTAAVIKQRAASRPIPEALRILPPGSWVVAPASSAPPLRAADPEALVPDGPPRMFHLDPAHRNRSPFRGPASPSLSILADLHDPIQTAPAVLPNGTVVVGTLGGNVHGVRNDGTLAFTTRLDDRVYASPLVVGDRIYLGSDDDRFVGVSSTGNVLWSLATDGDADTAAAPTPDHGLVFAAKDTLYFVRKDGTVVWRVRSKRKIYSSPAVGPDGTVFVGAQDRRVYGIRRTGTVRFATGVDQDVDCAPSLGERGTLYVGTDGGSVLALETEAGKVLWRAPVGGHVRAGLTVTRSHDVVAGVYGPSPRVVCLRGDTGEELWSFAVPGTGAREFGVHGSPVEDAEGNLYFGSQDDAVYSLTSNGELRWKVATGGDVDAPVVIVSDGVLLAASDDGKIYRIEERVGDR